MATTKWVLDTMHSEIQFKVKHLMISTVSGQFNKFEGSFETEDDNLLSAKASITIDVDSISTNNEQRDQHLKNGDFFDTPNHPQLTFTSDGIKYAGDGAYKIHGTLTLRGVSKEVVFDAEISEVVKDPWGSERIGVTANGKVNRKDFGVSFGLLSETGSVGLGNEVKMNINSQFVKQA